MARRTRLLWPGFRPGRRGKGTRVACSPSGDVLGVLRGVNGSWSAADRRPAIAPVPPRWRFSADRRCAHEQPARDAVRPPTSTRSRRHRRGCTVRLGPRRSRTVRTPATTLVEWHRRSSIRAQAASDGSHPVRYEQNVDPYRNPRSAKYAIPSLSTASTPSSPVLASATAGRAVPPGCREP
jgi:hypothetical protein